MSERLKILGGAALTLAAVCAHAGTVTFADLDGAANNAPFSPTYGVGLPVGVTATWSGFLLHQTSASTPMSIFAANDSAGNDCEVVFSAPVIISSMSMYDTTWGSAFSAIGYAGGAEVWRFDSSIEGSWQSVTTGAGLEIDTLVVEGKWNYVDDIVVELPGQVLQPGEVRLSMSAGSTPDEKQISWPGIYGMKDQLQSAATLSTNTVWQNEGDWVYGLGSTNTVAMDISGSASAFFRIVQEQIPADEISADIGVATNGLPVPPAGYVWAPLPAYSDEFNGSSLDATKWLDYHPYWNGREPSRHLPANVSVGGGKLRLKNSVITDPSNVNDPAYDVWVGAACVTSKNRTADLGYYEAKIKASSVCMTSAFWFQGHYSEIDVVEQMGVSYNNPYQEYWMAMNTHYYPGGWANDQNTPTHWTMPTRARDEYHVYGVWWKDVNTQWMYHNGIKVAEITTGGAFDEPQYMFFDTEVFRWQGLPTVANLNDDSKNTMYVDWVRGWELVPE